MSIETIFADYSNAQHEKDVVSLLNEYAKDPMGGGEELSTFTKDNLVRELSKIPHAFSVLCYVDRQPAGLINCFEGFSTFKCKSLINIHDVMVSKKYRGLGLSQQMLFKVEECARERGCCKITLEVLSGNDIAKKTYEKFGFSSCELDSKSGHYLFWQKVL